MKDKFAAITYSESRPNRDSAWPSGYIVQADSFNRSRIPTVIVVPLTTDIDLEDAPGNVFLETHEPGLPKDSVVVVSQISTFDRRRLVEKVRALNIGSMKSIEKGLKTVLEME